jgi:RNA polymerase sigma-70 factor (ECF subfamily)
MDFERLTQQHKDAVYRQMLRACGNREDAEDVLIEALLKAYRSLDDLDAPETFRAWLASIARRVCWQLKRREALKPLLQLSALEEGGYEMADAAPSAEEQVGIAEMKRLFAAVLDSLPGDARAVYQLRAVEELSGEETAERLGLTIAAMKSRWLRARKLVRERLDVALAGTPQLKFK